VTLHSCGRTACPLQAPATAELAEVFERMKDMGVCKNV
jgi:hypothetical protein